MISIDRRKLGQLTELGEGGMAKVYRVGSSVPGLPRGLAFKELLPTVTGTDRQQMLAAMRNVVALRAAMPTAEQAELDSLTTWPLAMVTDRGTEVGLLMRLLDDDFFIDERPPGGAPGRRVFEFQLLTARDRAQKLGIDISAADDGLVRLALMARLAYAIEIIHRPRGPLRLVYGDLNLRNAAVATTPPRILLVDCDGVADVNDLSRLQPNTPFFIPPELLQQPGTLQDQSTDVYKLALCVIRGLAIGKGTTQLTDPASPRMIPGLLDQAGVDLINRAVGPDRARRPTAEEIKEYLVGRILTLARPPELLDASLRRTLVICGSDVLVKWNHRYGEKVRIHGVNGFEVKNIDPDAHPNGYAVQPPTGGPIYVEVTNKHGADELLAGHLDYFDPPAFDLEKQLAGALPRLAVPDLPVTTMPDSLVELPPYPVFTAEIPAMPEIQLPAIEPLLNLGQLVPIPVFGAPGPREAFARAHEQAGEGIAAALGDGVQRMLDAAQNKINRLTP
ncbi:hypothetical protein [Frankia sp. Cj3]|uniref:hypothetical protein n=1 Tax=Frankia sp. Cj3 TaxID=2880976 RepID=UPI001EF60F13|nr:hypothetical protein [Frankia sp. Cj3]